MQYTLLQRNIAAHAAGRRIAHPAQLKPELNSKRGEGACNLLISFIWSLDFFQNVVPRLPVYWA